MIKKITAVFAVFTVLLLCACSPAAPANNQKNIKTLYGVFYSAISAEEASILYTYKVEEKEIYSAESGYSKDKYSFTDSNYGGKGLKRAYYGEPDGDAFIIYKNDGAKIKFAVNKNRMMTARAGVTLSALLKKVKVITADGSEYTLYDIFKDVFLSPAEDNEHAAILKLIKTEDSEDLSLYTLSEYEDGKVPDGALAITVTSNNSQDTVNISVNYDNTSKTVTFSKGYSQADVDTGYESLGEQTDIGFSDK